MALPFKEVDMVLSLLTYVIGDLGEGILSLVLWESLISIWIFVDICGFACLVLVLFLVLKYRGVYLFFSLFA